MASEPAELKRGRRFGRIFLMAAGGLAAPCLALAAFFLSSSGGTDTPAAKASIQGGRVTTPTTAAGTKPAAPVPTTSTTAPAAPLSPPARDPFRALVTQAPAAGTTKG